MQIMALKLPSDHDSNDHHWILNNVVFTNKDKFKDVKAQQDFQIAMLT